MFLLEWKQELHLAMLILLQSGLGFLVGFVFCWKTQHSLFVYLIKAHIYSTLFFHESYLSAFLAQVWILHSSLEVQTCMCRCFCFPWGITCFLRLSPFLCARYCFQSMVLACAGSDSSRAQPPDLQAGAFSLHSMLCSLSFRFISCFSMGKMPGCCSTNLP